VRDERRKDEREEDLAGELVRSIKIMARTVRAYMIIFCCFKICVVSSANLAAEKDACIL
jgi:hypothetical protein